MTGLRVAIQANQQRFGGPVAISVAKLRGPVDEIIAITARGNYRSQAVMLRIGMVPEPWRDFDHPKLADDHPLKAHVTWSLKRP